MPKRPKPLVSTLVWAFAVTGFQVKFRLAKVLYYGTISLNKISINRRKAFG